VGAKILEDHDAEISNAKANSQISQDQSRSGLNDLDLELGIVSATSRTIRSISTTVRTLALQ
jgi:hypothetical protein